MFAIRLCILALLATIPAAASAQTVRTPCSTTAGPQQLPGAPLEGREGCSGNNLIDLSTNLPLAAYWNSQFVGSGRSDQGFGAGITFLDTARVIDARTIEVQRAEGNVVRYSDGISEYALRDDSSTIRSSSTNNELQLIDTDLSRIRFVKTNGDRFMPTQYFDSEGRLIRENIFVNGYLSQIKDLKANRALQFTVDPPRGKYTSIQDGFGRSYALAYSGKGELASIKGPGGTGLAFSYESYGNLVELRNLKTGQLKMYSYYSQGNVLKGASNGTDTVVFTYSDTTATSVNSRTGVTLTAEFSRMTPSVTLATKRTKNGITLWTGQRNIDGNLTEITDAFNRKTAITYVPKTSLVAEASGPEGRKKYDYDQDGRAIKVTQLSPAGELVRTRTFAWSGVAPTALTELDSSGAPVCQIATQRSGSAINDSVSTAHTLGFTRQGAENRLTSFSRAGQSGRVTFDSKGSVTGMVSDGVSCSVQQTVSPAGIDVVALRAGLGLTASMRSDGAVNLTVGDRNGAVVLNNSASCSASSTGGTRSGATNFSSATGSVRTFSKSSWQGTDKGTQKQSTSGVSR